MVTLAETTELSEMHDAVGKWTQLWPRLTHWRKIVSQGDTATCLCHADNCQTDTSNLQKKIFARNILEKFWRLLNLGGGCGGITWRLSFIYSPHCPGYPRLILRGALKYLYFHPQSPLEREGEAKSIVTKYFSFLCHHKCQDLNIKGSLKERVSESFFHPRSPGWHQVS